MSTPLLCKNCGHWYTPQVVVPEICPHCDRSAHWTTEEPERKWELSENDRRFLRSIRIAATNDHEDDGA